MMKRSLIASAVVIAITGSIGLTPVSSQAALGINSMQVTHGPQGTGNYKGKRDKHEKPGPMNEKKRKKFGWIKKR